VIVTSPRGYPLGEHRRVGVCDNALYGELLHVPLLVQLPDRAHALTRTHRIVQPQCVHALLSQGASYVMTQLAEARGPAVAAYAASGTQRAIRTPAWFLRETRSGEQMTRELFAKPDDRWEANEISSLCAEAVETLAAELDRFAASAAGGQVSSSPPLAGILCDTWR